jgi:hypothetical protein
LITTVNPVTATVVAAFTDPPARPDIVISRMLGSPPIERVAVTVPFASVVEG